MLWSRAAAVLLLATLLAALLPAAQGAGCRLCGKVGRCCCFLRPAAAPPAAGHCAMGGSSDVCSLTRSAARPAAFRNVETLPERTAAFAVLTLPGAPEIAGCLGEVAARRPTPFHFSPPTPPPRLRLV